VCRVQGVECRVWTAGCGVQGVQCTVYSAGPRAQVQSVGPREQGPVCTVGFIVQGPVFNVWHVQFPMDI
jgi:hypothetical protein